VSSAPVAVDVYSDEALWPSDASELADVKTFHDSRKARLAGEIADGAMLELEVLHRHLFGAMRQFRDAAQRLPDSHAADAAATLGTDVFGVHGTLRAAIDDVLTAAATMFQQSENDT
jgi:hypothetical protein